MGRGRAKGKQDRKIARPVEVSPTRLVWTWRACRPSWGTTPRASVDNGGRAGTTSNGSGAEGPSGLMVNSIPCQKNRPALGMAHWKEFLQPKRNDGRSSGLTLGGPQVSGAWGGNQAGVPAPPPSTAGTWGTVSVRRAREGWAGTGPQAADDGRTESQLETKNGCGVCPGWAEVRNLGLAGPGCWQAGLGGPLPQTAGRRGHRVARSALPAKQNLFRMLAHPGAVRRGWRCLCDGAKAGPRTSSRNIDIEASNLSQAS